jgi:hypothetical protein
LDLCAKVEKLNLKKGGVCILNNRRRSGRVKPIIFVALEIIALYLMLNILSILFLKTANSIVLMTVVLYFFISSLQRFMVRATRKSDMGSYNKT